MRKVVGKRTEGNGKKRQFGRGPSRGGKLSLAGTKIVSAFEEAIAVMRTGEPWEGRLTVRT